MKKTAVFIIVCISFLFLSQAANAQSVRDVLYLKNGSIIKGFITEITPEKNVKIETMDGSLFVYSMEDVEKMAKESFYDYQASTETPPQQQIRYAGYKEPGLSFLFSLLLPGGGQFYNGQTGRGVGYLCGSYGAYLVGGIFIATSESTDYYGYSYTSNAGMATIGAVLVIGGVITHIVSMIDAPVSAKRINRANGYALRLNVAPDIILQDNYLKNTNFSNSVSYGLKLKISF